MSQPAKVLLLYAHPESQDSVANRVLLKPATQLSNVTVHDLYAHYPDFFIDIPREQALLREHEVIVFHQQRHGVMLPLRRYSAPHHVAHSVVARPVRGQIRHLPERSIG